MADAPEIPEANNPFEKQVAISIAVLAVFLSVIGNLGDNAKTDAILKTNEATNKWAYYQAKSIKQQLTEMHGSLLGELSSAQTDPARLKATQDKLREEQTRYESEKAGIRKEAEELTAKAELDSRINDRCDLSSLMLQIGVVICSVAILSHWRAFWYVGLALGIGGAITGITAFLM